MPCELNRSVHVYTLFFFCRCLFYSIQFKLTLEFCLNVRLGIDLFRFSHIRCTSHSSDELPMFLWSLHWIPLGECLSAFAQFFLLFHMQKLWNWIGWIIINQFDFSHPFSSYDDVRQKIARFRSIFKTKFVSIRESTRNASISIRKYIALTQIIWFMSDDRFSSCRLCSSKNVCSWRKRCYIVASMTIRFRYENEGEHHWQYHRINYWFSCITLSHTHTRI